MKMIYLAGHGPFLPSSFPIFWLYLNVDFRAKEAPGCFSSERLHFSLGDPC
jgi:hypothetical protein